MRRAVLCSLLLVAVACSGSGGDDGGSAASTSAPAPSTSAPPLYEPSYAANACDGEVPADPRIECGTMTVPADRSAPDAGDVTIPVAIIRSADPSPLPDPIIYFSGGPGDDGRNIAGHFLELELGGRHDVIVFDQRGTGASTPSLDCPELTETMWASLGAATDAFAEADVYTGVLLDCRVRLVAAGVDLDAYDTPTTAADIEDLRRALGIDSWNLFGVSYGARVALEVVRQHPETVRSVVLDSVYAQDVGLGADVRLATARRAIDVLAGGCAADPGCAAANGDFHAGLQALVDAWNAEPFTATATDPATGQDRPLVITGDDVVAGLFQALYDSSLIGVLPSLLEPLLARDDVADAIVPELALDSIETSLGAAEGLGTSVDCADRQALGGPTAIETAAEAPLYRGLLAGSDHHCDLWDVESVDRSFNDPVVSDLPALILGDEYDPVTPPADSERAAEGFANGTFLLFPGLGHGAVFTGGCPLEIFRAFIDAPTAPVVATCIESMSPPAWAT